VGPDYLKWDNNYWISCDRSSHGHGDADGNLARGKGLYGILAALRARYPDLSIEDCASGGNRLDLGMVQYMDDTSGPSTRVRHNLEGLNAVFPPAYLLSFVMDGRHYPDASAGCASPGKSLIGVRPHPLLVRRRHGRRETSRRLLPAIIAA